MNLIFSRFAFALSLALAAPATAQQVNPDPIENVRRYQIIYYKWVPGGASRVREIVWGTMLPAMREAGVPLPIILHPDTGEWDMVALLPLDGGYADLHFNVSPTDARWHSIAARRAGSIERWNEMGAELQRLTARRDSIIAHEHQ